KLGYLAVVACAANREEAYRRAEAMRAYFAAAPRIDPQFRNIRGLEPVETNLRVLTAQSKAGQPRTFDGASKLMSATIEDLINSRLMFVGTPDEVYEQIAQFNTEV